MTTRNVVLTRYMHADESGWAWFIPLHNGLTSVGIVMEQKQLGIRSRAVSSATTAPLPASSEPLSSRVPSNGRTHATLADRYLTFLHLAPGVQALIGDHATLERVEDENGQAPAARSASDFSYSADSYAGEGWRLVGDAGGKSSMRMSCYVRCLLRGQPLSIRSFRRACTWL